MKKASPMLLFLMMSDGMLLRFQNGLVEEHKEVRLNALRYVLNVKLYVGSPKARTPFGEARLRAFYLILCKSA